MNRFPSRRRIFLRAGAALCAAALLAAPLAARAQEKAVPKKPAPAKADKKPPFDAAILIDADTGQVLEEYQADKAHLPASLVKMMLMLVVMEAVKRKEFSLDQEIIVSREASRMGGSQVYLKEGEVFTMGELLKTVVMASANDSAYALAEHIAGTPEAMVELMNTRAKELGLRNTHYTNVHGLPADPGEEKDFVSARDTAMLAMRLVRYPLLLKWGKTRRDLFRDGKFVLYNTNRLLRRVPGMDGIKTGYYDEAGFNLAATVKRGNLRLISVVLGATSRRERDRQTRRLLNLGFRVYRKVTYFRKRSKFKRSVPVSRGRKRRVRVAPAKPASVLVKRIHISKVKTRLKLPEKLDAPLKKGQRVGEAEVVLGGKVLARVPLLAAEEVARLRWYERLMFWRW